MRTSLLAVLVLAAAVAAAVETPMKKPEAVSTRLSFKGPAGWLKSEYANSAGADPVVEFEKGSDRVSIDLFGAAGSAYKTPEAFLLGPAATTMGKAPARAGEATVAGRAVAVWRRQFPIADSGPHMTSAAPPRMGTETFCVLPPSADGRFAVLSYARENPIPDPEGRGEKAWKAFLKTVKPVAAKK